MSTRYVPPHPGGATTTGDCATLPCLSRPRFHCGMVLTDDHLTDLETWVQQRLALHRFVEGWGTVTGLEVGRRCEDPVSVIRVGPGYARSCCGDDVVLCAEQPLDVCGCRDAGPCCPPAAADGEEQAVDVYLALDETPVDADPTAVPCGCGGHDEPQFERICETGTLRCAPVADPATDPATLAAEAWERGFTACSAVVAEYLAALSDDATDSAVRTWLVAWIDRRDGPTRGVLGPVRDRIAAADTALDAAARAALLLDIVLAVRRHYVVTTYATCLDPNGVRLARVWTARSTAGGCAVTCVDAEPPYRRVLAPPGWPSPPGEVNVAPLLGQRWRLARPQLRPLGLEDDLPTQQQLTGPEALLRELGQDRIFWPYGTKVQAVLYKDPCGRWGDGDDVDGRVVRFVESRDDDHR